MSFMQQYGEIIIAVLTTLTTILGVLGGIVVKMQLNIRSDMKSKDIVMHDQQREMEQMKSDARNRDQQLALVQQLAESGAKRELLYTETQTRREEAWQKTIETFATTITQSLQNLTSELKQDRDRFAESISQNTQTIKNLSDVLEVQILKLSTVDSSQTSFMKDARTALHEVVSVNKATNENSDHLLLTVEAIRDHILKEKEETRPILNLVNNKLDEVLNLLKGESSHVLQKPFPALAAVSAVPAVADNSGAGDNNNTGV